MTGRRLPGPRYHRRNVIQRKRARTNCAGPGPALPFRVPPGRAVFLLAGAQIQRFRSPCRLAIGVRPARRVHGKSPRRCRTVRESQRRLLPDPPGRLARAPQVVEQDCVLVGIHAVPEAFVAVAAEPPVASMGSTTTVRRSPMWFFAWSDGTGAAALAFDSAGFLRWASNQSPIVPVLLSDGNLMAAYKSELSSK